MAACPSCGAELPEGARFCPACGAALAAPAPAERMLKLATILFADVVGSTARAEQMHPEDVGALMADFFGAMAAEIRAEGGTIEKYAGDAVMAVFGVPTAHEDDPLRAVRAARRMLARLERWNDERQLGLAVRIGVNTGEVLAAPGASISVTGDAVNVAARLEQASEAGQILVGARTADAVRGAFELQPVEPLALKGKTESVPAWVIVDEQERLEERGVPGLRSPLVGRDEELDSLRSAFARVQADGAPHLVTILADAGVGKSRLVREFVGGLDVETKVVVGRCLPYGDGVTLWPLGEILKGEALMLENEPPETARAKVDALVEATILPELAPDRARTAAALVSTVGLVGEDYAADPREAYRDLLAGWRAFLSSLAREQRLVVLVEDIHWADGTMLDVLDDLAERVQGPVLFLCTSRPDLLRTRPDWGGGRRNYSSLPLEPLTLDETSALVSALLDVDDLPAGLRGRILERSEGNPFFLEEIVRRLIDEGILSRENSRWQAAGQPGDIEIPDNVQAVILARIDLLDQPERRALQHAAVVGRTFWRGGLVRLVGDDRLDDILRTLVRRELVLEQLTSSLGGDAEYSFKHVLTRDVAYESLPRRERARVHVEVAAWLEETSGERAGELAEFLAHHYDQAWSLTGDDDARRRAREAYLTAAESATRRFALRQTERFAERAVELAAPGAERGRTYAHLAGRLYERTNQGELAWRAYASAIDELGTESPEFIRLASAAAIVATRWHGTLLRHPPAADLRDLIDRGLAAAPAESRERVLLLTSRTFMQVMGYEPTTPEGERAAREAVELAERLGDARTLSAALDAAGAILQAAGRYRELWDVERRRVELVERLTDVLEIGDTFAMAAWTATYIGEYAEGRDYARRGVEATRSAGPGVFAHCLSWLAYARFMAGEWDAALADLMEIEGLSSEDPRGVPPGPYMRAYAVGALCRELRGERSEADRLLEVVERFLAMQPRSGLVGGVGYAARALAHRGRPDEAWRLFPADFPRADGRCVLLEAFCDVAGSDQDWARAQELLPRAREEAEFGGLLALPLFADRLEGRMLAAEGEDEAAARLLGRSTDGFARLGAPWEEAWSRLLLAELTGDRTAAEHALRVFEPLRSVREIERARAVVGAPARTREPGLP